MYKTGDILYTIYIVYIHYTLYKYYIYIYSVISYIYDICIYRYICTHVYWIGDPKQSLKGGSMGPEVKSMPQQLEPFLRVLQVRAYHVRFPWSCRLSWIEATKMVVYWDIYRDIQYVYICIHIYIYPMYSIYIYISIYINTTDYSQEVNWITAVFCQMVINLKKEGFA